VDLMEEATGRKDGQVNVYIFGSKGIKGLNVLGEVPDNQVDALILLPNKDYGSDHISLVVDFELVGNTPEEYWIWLNKGKIAVGIVVVVITILLWKCWDQ